MKISPQIQNILPLNVFDQWAPLKLLYLSKLVSACTGVCSDRFVSNKLLAICAMHVINCIAFIHNCLETENWVTISQMADCLRFAVAMMYFAYD